MPPIYINGQEVVKRYVGDREFIKAYVGSQQVFSGAGAWSPSSLFASGEQGAWYDPSDLSTMFQDAAGTIPVTADGQPVGLILDKSQGLVLGPELVTNGDFSGGLTGWTVAQDKSGDVSIASGKVRTISDGIADSSIHNAIGQNVPTVVGRTYKVSFDVTLVIPGAYNYRVQIGVVDIIPWASPGSSGTKTCFFTATSTTSFVNINGISFNSTGEVLLDNISVKEVPGNHASQSTAAARPLYKTDGTYHWLQFDGVDDSLSTAAINFTSTDKMSVFAGLVTTDNVGFDGIIQLGSLASGGFWSYFNVATLEFKVQGSSGVSAVSSVYTPASRSVLTSLMNLGGATGQNCLSTRKNASLFANASIVAGAANFQNGVMTIGVVTGVLLTGNIYSLIVRGALSSAQQITDTETWVNSKTGAY